MKTIGIALIALGLVAGIGGVFAGLHFVSQTPTTTTTPTPTNSTCSDGPLYMIGGAQYFSNNSTVKIVLNGTATLARAVVKDNYGNTISNQTLPDITLYRSTDAVYLTAPFQTGITYTVLFVTLCNNQYSVSATIQ